MRILLLTPFLPDPVASHGGGSYIGALAASLSRSAEVGLVHLAHAGEPATPSIDWHWRTSARYQGLPPPGSRGLHLARMMWRWRRLPLLAAKHWQPQLPVLLQRARDEFRPEVALVELAQMAQYLPYLHGIPTIFTDHEAGRPANAATGFGSWADRRDAHLWRAYLERFYGQATLLQAVTDEDAATLSSQLGRRVLTRPAAVEIPSAGAQPGAAPPRALFLGDYRHRPNREAAERLVREVLPRLRAAAPGSELWLAGPHDEAIRHLAGSAGLSIRGYAPDLAELMASVRVVLAPLWSGGGFRVKLAAALAHGLPVVTNALGARGCRAPEPACTIAETSTELAAATARHLLSAESADRAGRIARQWACDNLAPSAVASVQLQHLEQLLEQRPRP